MAEQDNAATVALQLEKVRTKLPLLYKREDIFLTQIQERADVEKVSSRSMRVPLQIRPGGRAGQATMDGDDLGRGSGTRYEPATLSPIFFRFAVEITKLVEYATNNSNKAIANAAKREVKQGMRQFRSFLNAMAQTAGDGVLGEIESVAANVFTMDLPHRADLVYHNQIIQVYSADLQTNRGTAEITSIDPEAGTITVDLAPGGTVATDLIVLDGVSGADPVSLFGLKYHHNDASTGLWLNLDRANFPEIRTPRVDAGSAALTTGPIRLALNKIRKALGAKVLQGKKLVAYMNVEQEHAYEALGIVISEIIKQGTDKEGLDLFFSGRKTMSGVPILADTQADPTRIDYAELGAFGRAVMKDIDLYEVGGRTVWPIRGASGGLASAYLFYFVHGFQLFHENPRCGSYIDGLTRPAGY